MFFSDEPGYYKAGEYGIRLETIVRVVRKEFEDNPEESEDILYLTKARTCKKT